MNPKPLQNKTAYGALLATIATIIWSGNFIIARGVIKDIPPVTLAFYRWLSATVILLPFAWKYFLPELHYLKKHFFYFMLTAVAGVSLFNTFVYIAGHYTEAVNMALIGTTSSPIMSVLLARIFLKEKITPLRVIGMIICIFGILLLLSKGHLENLISFSFSKGDWWMLAAAFTFAIYNVCAKKKPADMHPVNFLFSVFLLGTLFLFPFYWYEFRTTGGIAIDLPNISAILYLGIGASVICFLLWNIAIGHLGAGRASLFGNLIPVFSTVEAVLILKEKINWVHYSSFILVVLGLVIANIQKRK
ncbi:MAG: EamA family transporter [Terrimonas sp.]|nr:EamA family transporter [Terrimonas sp.]